MAREIDVDVLAMVAAVALLAASLALALSPSLAAAVPGPIEEADAALDEDLVSGALAVLLGVAAAGGLLRLRGILAADSDDEAASGRRDAGLGPRSSTGNGRRRRGRRTDRDALVGEAFTDEYEARRDALRAESGNPEPEPTRGLRRTAIAVQLAEGHDPATARSRLQHGDWTDDPVAAAFMGGPEAGHLSLRHRLYELVAPERSFERRFRRTVRALEAAAERDGPVGARSESEGEGPTTAGASEEAAESDGQDADAGGAGQPGASPPDAPGIDDTELSAADGAARSTGERAETSGNGDGRNGSGGVRPVRGMQGPVGLPEEPDAAGGDGTAARTLNGGTPQEDGSGDADGAADVTDPERDEPDSSDPQRTEPEGSEPEDEHDDGVA